ncbi:nuclear transport factor 2 family protein [Streptomyces hainanensis]|uniref:Nuclear transport factor 2 family protein n=1 Tax=Streptomyces hainanensis TaxID=402648 RepID=A0A4R4TE79_9ACTN|nr:nuclear transport factor 2 family protein [Streptomyces hainanensis]TDC73894.1 nuclear transport factor 2 family protein [Streptomyces hainanensis]
MNTEPEAGEAGAPPEALTPIDRLLAERACERLLLELVHRLDLGEPGGVAELFTPDGVWEWPEDGRRFVGRDALRGYFAGRPADRLSRRMSTNLLVTVTSPTTARATSYFATYRVDGYTGGLLPPRAPTQVGHYTDAFRRLDGEWLLAHRVLTLSFGGPTERLAAPVSPPSGPR